LRAIQHDQLLSVRIGSKLPSYMASAPRKPLFLLSRFGLLLAAIPALLLCQADLTAVI